MYSMILPIQDILPDLGIEHLDLELTPLQHLCEWGICKSINAIQVLSCHEGPYLFLLDVRIYENSNSSNHTKYVLCVESTYHPFILRPRANRQPKYPMLDIHKPRIP